MSSEEKLKFSESCQTLSLKKSEIFMSSFAGKIVIGEPNYLGYLDSQSFQFKHNEFLDLYLSLVKIVQYFACDSNIEDKGLILTPSENIIYFWSGKVVQKNQNTEKVVKLGKEINDNITFEIILNIDQFNEVVYTFSLLMLTCLCLKSTEIEVIEDITEELSITRLLSFKRKKVCSRYLKEYIKAKEIDNISDYNLCQLLIYYNELIIIYKKIKSMINPVIHEIHRIESILKD
jgi:hypothetical protein